MIIRSAIIASVLLITCCLDVFAQGSGRTILPGHVPDAVKNLVPKGPYNGTNQLYLAIGLPLRNSATLDQFLQQLQDPQSTNYHRYLTPSEFTERFGPTEQDYAAVRAYAETNGFTVVETHGNRLVLDVEGSAANAERAFNVSLNVYSHPTEARDFFAPDADPSVPAHLPVADITGLSDFPSPRPLVRHMHGVSFKPLAGSGSGGTYIGQDFRNAYAPGVTLTGAGQTVGLLQFDGYNASNITDYENLIGVTNYVPLTNVLLDGYNGAAGSGNIEVCLDIEMAISMAPGLTRIIVYEGNPKFPKFNPTDVVSRMANDNLAKQLSSSWTWSGGPNATIDAAFKQMAAQGQSFFQAAGDDDAYTGSQVLDASGQVNSPVASSNVTAVGGTTLTMSGTGASYSSERVWNWNTSGQPNVGSGGGVSTYYTIPPWQTNIAMSANLGSTNMRNVPDVALTADNVWVIYTQNGGTASGSVGGTSCAAPLWVGFCALVNQQSTASGGATVGFLNPTVYKLGTSTNYTQCFHDITTGNNVGTNTPGLYPAVSGYDLCTGWGTPNGIYLINYLAPRPYFLSQPLSQSVVAGTNVAFSVGVGGLPPFAFRWLFNGTNLTAGGNVSGVNSNVLSITSVTAANAGNYSVVVTNASGAITSSVAVLTVSAPPVLVPLTNQTIECSGTANFAVSASGATPLAYRWSFDGAFVAGATNSTFAVTNVHLPDHAVLVIVTNIYGSATSSATLAVVDTQPPLVTLNGTNRMIVELGSGFVDPGATAVDACAGSVAVSVSGSVNTAVAGTNVLVYSANDGNGNTNSAVRTVIVRDTVPPVISWSFTNMVLAADTNCGAAMPVVTGTNDIVATDASGTLIISQLPTNNTELSLGTNVVVITVADSSGNIAFSTNTIVVADQTPPVILTAPQSQTNFIGSAAAFSVVAAACTPLAYQWFFDAVPLTGATNSTLTISNVTTSAAGDYFVVATAQGGSFTSIVATLTAVLPSNAVPVIGSVVQLGGQEISIDLSGAAGFTYILEMTTNLGLSNGWMPLTTNTPGTNGMWSFTDSITNNPQKFYRLKLVQ